jgi:hypothetical protein
MAWQEFSHSLGQKATLFDHPAVQKKRLSSALQTGTETRPETFRSNLNLPIIDDAIASP